MSPSQTAAQNDVAEAMALGFTSATIVKSDQLLGSTARMQTFLASVKAKVKNLDAVQKASASWDEVADVWSLNAEYVVPKETAFKSTIKVSDYPAFVKFAK
ncbi:hypothetical protein D3C87_1618130 [compost metagenome]